MKILVLDGGGVFGIGQALIASQADVSKFDVLVGTSIGAQIAAYIAQGQDTTKLPAFFHEKMPLIFAGNWWRQYNPVTPRFPDRELNKAQQALLSGTFGNVKKPLFVTAANLESQKLKVFNSSDPQDAAWPMWEVIRCSAAAETYFAPWKGYSDGGVFANNPSMVAIASVSSILNVDIRDMEVLSIGTGEPSTNIIPPADGDTIIKWGKWFLEAMLSGSSNSMHEYFARSLPLKKYCRIQFIRNQNWGFTNPDDMLEAEHAWKTEIQTAVQTVDNF